MKTLLSLTCVLCATSLFATGKTFYVSPTGDGTNPQAGFATGFATVEAAIASADVTVGDMVILDKTTFTLASNITVNKAIILRGAGENWETVLNGNKSKNMSLTVAGALLHNFTITNMGGQWAGAAGISMSSASTISNVVVRQIGNLWQGAKDGTRFPVTLSAGTLTHCWITNNVMPSNAGVHLNGACTVENCYIANNVDRGCSSTESYCGVVVISSTSAILRNCTIVNNESGFGGIYCRVATCKVYNNIIRGNTAGGATCNWFFKSGLTPVFTSWKANCTDPITGMPAGNIAEDPMFRSDNLHFMSKSPCNHTADPAYAPAYDIMGNPRGDTPSMGCIEYEQVTGFACLVVPSATTVTAPATITLRADIADGTPTGPLSYAWDYDGDGNVDSTAAEPVLSEIGKFTPSVVVTDSASVTANATCPQTIAIAPVGGFVVYASPTGDGTNPYGGFATGFSSIQDAIDFAATGEKVMLDRATFVLSYTIYVNKAIELCGAGENWETVLDGNKGSGISVTMAKAFLHNFTFTNMGSQFAGSVCIMEVASTISNVVARKVGNKWTGATDGTRYPFLLSAGTLTHCWITNNVMPNNAGAALSGSAVMENCLLADNVDRGCAQASSVYGGVVRISGNNAVIRNCTIVSNSSPYSAVWVRNYINNNYDGSKSQLYNNIIWNNCTNSTTECLYNWNLDPAESSTEKMKANCTYPRLGSADDGNIGADPLFKNPAAGNYHLRAGSPCVNAGLMLNYTADSIDLDGNKRIFTFGGKYSKSDLGCFESPFGAPGFYLLLR